MTIRIFRNVPRDAKEWARWFRDQGFEPSLGNPPEDGYVLSSSAAGVREWVQIAGGNSQWTLNRPQEAYLTPLSSGGIVDRSVWQYVKSRDRWEDKVNLDLPDGGYFQLRDANSAAMRFAFDEDGSVNITGITAWNFEVGDRIDWGDTTYVELNESGAAGEVLTDIYTASAIENDFEDADSTSFVDFPNRLIDVSTLTDGAKYFFYLQSGVSNRITNNTNDNQVRLFDGNAAISGSLANYTDSEGIGFPYQFGLEQTIDSAGDDITLQGRTNLFGVRSESWKAFGLNVSDLSADDYKFVDDAGPTDVTGSATATGATTTVGAGTWMVFASVQMNGLTATTDQSVYISDGTTDYLMSAPNAENSLTEYMLGGFIVFEDLAADTVLTVKASAGSSGSAGSVGRAMICAIRVSAFAEAHTQFTAATVADGRDTTTPYDTLSFTADTTGEMVFFAGARLDFIATRTCQDYVVKARVNSGSYTDLSKFERLSQEGFGITMGAVATPIGTLSVTAGDTVDVVVYTNNGSNVSNAQASSRSIAAIMLETASTLGRNFILGDLGASTLIEGSSHEVRGDGTSDVDFTDILGLNFEDDDVLKWSSVAFVEHDSVNSKFILGDASYTTQIDGQDVVVTAAANFDGAATFDSTIGITGTATFNGANNFNGNSTFDGDVTFNGTVTGIDTGFDIPSGDKLTGEDSTSTAQDLAQLALGGGDSDFDSVGLLADFQGADAATSYTELSNNGYSATFVGDAQLDTAQFKFGSSSLLLDGTGDYVTFPNQDDWNFGSGDFTVDIWVRPAVDLDTNNHVLISWWNDAANRNGWVIQAFGGNLLFGYSTNGSTSTDTATVTGLTWDPNTWYLISWVRSGTTMYMFRDGVLLDTYAAGSDTIFDANTELWIGALNLSGPLRPWNGHIGEVRITKGVARYTSTFTVPTEAYPTSSGSDTVVIGDADLPTEIRGTVVDIPTAFRLPRYSNATRPSPGNEGHVIWNTDDGQINVDDGTNWTLPDGTTT